MSVEELAVLDAAGAEVMVQRACDVEGCDFVATGPPKGARSAPWQLGVHRYRAHGLRGSHAPAPRSTQRGKAKGKTAKRVADEEFAERPARAVIQDIADELGNRAGPPNAEELTRGLGRGVGLLTVALASYLAETDPTIPDGPQGEAQRDSLVDYLSLSDSSAREVMAPIARLTAPTRLNKRFGRQVVDNVDAVGSISELAILALHFRRYARARRLRMESMGLREAAAPSSAAANGHAAAPVDWSSPGEQWGPAAPAHTPPPTRGVVLSGENMGVGQPTNGGTPVES